MKIPKVDDIRENLKSLTSKFGVILFGSVNSGDNRAESDIDIAVITKNTDRETNISLQTELLGKFGTRYDIRVFELYPISIQISIIKNYSIIYGDILEISEYFYYFRKN